MNEIPSIKSQQNSSSLRIVRHTLNVTLMGILSSCTLQKPVSTEALTKYPSVSQVIQKPFVSEASEGIKNLSNFFLKGATTEYVDDNGNTIHP